MGQQLGQKTSSELKSRVKELLDRVFTMIDYDVAIKEIQKLKTTISDTTFTIATTPFEVIFEYKVAAASCVPDDRIVYITDISDLISQADLYIESCAYFDCYRKIINDALAEYIEDLSEKKSKGKLQEFIDHLKAERAARLAQAAAIPKAIVSNTEKYTKDELATMAICHVHQNTKRPEARVCIITYKLIMKFTDLSTQIENTKYEKRHLNEAAIAAALHEKYQDRVAVLEREYIALMKEHYKVDPTSKDLCVDDVMKIEYMLWALFALFNRSDFTLHQYNNLKTFKRDYIAHNAYRIAYHIHKEDNEEFMTILLPCFAALSALYTKNKPEHLTKTLDFISKHNLLPQSLAESFSTMIVAQRMHEVRKILTSIEIIFMDQTISLSAFQALDDNNKKLFLDYPMEAQHIIKSFKISLDIFVKVVHGDEQTFRGLLAVANNYHQRLMDINVFQDWFASANCDQIKLLVLNFAAIEDCIKYMNLSLEKILSLNSTSMLACLNGHSFNSLKVLTDYYLIDFDEIMALSELEMSWLLEEPTQAVSKFYASSTTNPESALGTLDSTLMKGLNLARILINKGWLSDFDKLQELPIKMAKELRAKGVNFELVRALYIALVFIHHNFGNAMVQCFVPNTRVCKHNVDNEAIRAVSYRTATWLSIKLDRYKIQLQKLLTERPNYSIQEWAAEVDIMQQQFNVHPEAHEDAAIISKIRAINNFITSMKPNLRNGNFNIRHMVLFNMICTSKFAQQFKDIETHWKAFANEWPVALAAGRSYEDVADELDSENEVSNELAEFTTFYQLMWSFKRYVGDPKLLPTTFMVNTSHAFEGVYTIASTIATADPVGLQRSLDAGHIPEGKNRKGVDHFVAALLTQDYNIIAMLYARLTQKLTAAFAAFLRTHKLATATSKNKAGDQAFDIALRTNNGPMITMCIVNMVSIDSENLQYTYNFEFIKKGTYLRAKMQDAMNARNHVTANTLFLLHKLPLRPAPQLQPQTEVIARPRLTRSIFRSCLG